MVTIAHQSVTNWQIRVILTSYVAGHFETFQALLPVRVGEFIMSNVTALTAVSFKNEVLKADKPYLVDFWAEWCGPCRAIGPVVEQIAGEYADKLLVGKVNVDEEQSVAQEFRVMSIPTLILFKDGTIATTVVGAMPKEQLLSKIESFL